MSRRGIILTLTFLSLSSLQVAAQKNQPTKAQEEARKREDSGNILKNWPKEEVPYIIDPDEEKAFKGLKTDEEREQFIEAFWFRRDPTPDSIDNEFRDDYYRKIVLANERYTSGIAGWRTDRGKILIMHGEPDDIETHAMGGRCERSLEEGGGETDCYPFEKWRYRYIEGIGNNVILEFVDSSMSGEYRLEFDPSAKDAFLLIPGMGLTDYELANGLTKENRMDAADRAGNPRGVPMTMTESFDRLQQYYDILKPPPVKFKDLEAIVTSRISHNVLPFDFRADFLKVTESRVFVPITVQVAYKNLTFKEDFASDGSKFMSAVGRIEGQVSNFAGRVVERIEDYINVQVPAAQFRPDGVAIYQKALNLPPGLYKIFLLMNDSKSNNTGTIDRRLEVKRFPDGNLSASSLILADRISSLPPRAVATMFQIGSLKVWPSVKKEFRRDQDMNVFLQVYGLKLDEKTHKPSVVAEVLITRDGNEVRKLSEEISELAGAAQQMNFVKQIAMKDLDPGEYAIQVKITDKLAGAPHVTTDKFTVR